MVPDLAKAKKEAEKEANGTVKMEAQDKEAASTVKMEAPEKEANGTMKMEAPETEVGMTGHVEQGTSWDADAQSAVSMVESTPVEDLSAEVQLTLDMNLEQIKETKKEQEFTGICSPHARARALITLICVPFSLTCPSEC